MWLRVCHDLSLRLMCTKHSPYDFFDICTSKEEKLMSVPGM